MSDVLGTVAWVIGGSGGIGSAIALSLAEKGVSVGIGYFSAKEKATQIVKKICSKEYNVTALAVHVDVRDPCSVQRAYDQIADVLGYPSIIIYAAGQTKVALFQDCTESDLNKMIEIHAKGVVYVIQTSLPFLLQQKKGRIILLSSIWGEVGGACEVLYSMVKGAQIALTKSLAKELAPSGITVNAVTPGAIQTEMLARQLTGEDKEHLIKQIPLGRIGSPEEVAVLVRYLGSEQASYITGQVIRVSGGWDG